MFLLTNIYFRPYEFIAVYQCVAHTLLVLCSVRFTFGQ